MYCSPEIFCQLPSSTLKILLTHIVFLLSTSIACAQGIRQLPEKDVYQFPQFISLHQAKQTPDFSLVKLSYQSFDGDFNRPQLPASGQMGAFTASGRKEQEFLIWQGDFSFQYQRDDGQQWNNTSLHPDEQPYLWADEGTGQWDRNHFNANVQLGSVREGSFNWGVSVFLKGGQGDRFNDPKPLYRYRRLGIAPEVSWRFNQENFLAVQLNYSNYSEDNEIGFFSVDDPLLYRLRGYGTFTRTPFVSGERQLKQQSIGSVLRWINVKSGQFDRWIVEVAGQLRQGSAAEGTAIITPGGKWEALQGNFSVEKVLQSFNYAHSIKVSGTAQETAGVDAVFQAINTRLQTALIGLGWTLAKTDSANFNWQLGIHAAVSQRFQEDLAAFTEAEVQGLPITMNFQTAWKRDKISPFLSLTGNYFHALNTSLQVGSENALNELIVPDFEILTTNSYMLRAAAGVDWKYSKGVFRLSAFAQLMRAAEANTSLSQSQFGLSIAFSPQGIFNLPTLQEGKQFGHL